MARYNRINIDGRAETENRLMAENALPGTVVYINGDQFHTAEDGAGEGVQLYALGVDTLQGRRVTDEVNAGDVGIGNYLETGRSFAMRVAPGTVLKMDTPLSIGVKELREGVPGEDHIVAFSKEIYTVSDTGAELVIVRIA